MLPVTVHVPDAGLKSSALESTVPAGSDPPATSTWPLSSKVAVWLVRAGFRLPLSVPGPAVPGAGSGAARVSSAKGIGASGRVRGLQLLRLEGIMFAVFL